MITVVILFYLNFTLFNKAITCGTCSVSPDAKSCMCLNEAGKHFPFPCCFNLNLLASLAPPVPSLKSPDYQLARMITLNLGGGI